MRRVTGIGGVFFKANDPEKLRERYRKHLGIDVQEWGGAVFFWKEEGERAEHGSTTWSVAPQSSEYFEPSTAPFMINYRVEDLRAVLELLREEGCRVVESLEESEFGLFGWVMDPEGNKVELWQPPED
jgi:predicted enzyme related to lactoylglutathione lyase